MDPLKLVTLIQDRPFIKNQLILSLRICKFRNLYLFHDNYKQPTANKTGQQGRDFSFMSKMLFRTAMGPSRQSSSSEQADLSDFVLLLCQTDCQREMTKVVKIQATPFFLPPFRIKPHGSSLLHEVALVEIASILIAVVDNVVVQSDNSFDSLHRVFVVVEKWTPQNTAAQDTKGILNNSPGSRDSEILKTVVGQQ